MSANFDASLTSDRDRVRLLLGDVPEGAASGTVDAPLLQDETIDAALTQNSYTEAVRQLVMGLISRYSGEPDKYEEGNGLRLEWRTRLDGWKIILKEVKDTVPAAAPRPGIAIGQLTAPNMCRMRTD